MVIPAVMFSVLLLLVLCFLFYKFVFLRDPKRNVPPGNNIVAPADGRIIKILKLNKINGIEVRKGLVGKIRALVPINCKEGYLITIMMNLFDVHVQRSPVGGVVLNIKHYDGRFNNAVYGDKFENGLVNEKNEITIKNNKIGSINVVQIAGFVARRIECFVEEKQKLNKGQKLGRIIMGSQVSLILPKKVKLQVKEGDKVKAGKSILGVY